MIKKIAFFSMPVENMEDAKKFYGEILGLENSATYEDKWVEFDTPDKKSIALNVYAKKPTLALETDNIEEEVARLKGLGVKIRTEFFEGQEIVDHKTCKMSIIEDGQGNLLMLHEIAPDRA